MEVYKICQPCRAYNLNPNSYEAQSGSGSRDSNDGGSNDLEDGEGYEEQWGYNCYDSAGYTNCHQCYKFQAKTDMEEASMDDLQRASDQGTIIEIKVDGVNYGQNGFES